MIRNVRLATLLSLVVSVLGMMLSNPMQSRVVEAVLKPDNTRGGGPCPVTFNFTGYIKTDGPATVKYTFNSSDGGTGPAYTLEFKTAGTQPVTTTWTIGDAKSLPAYDGWKTINILSPNPTESSRETGKFMLRCDGASKTIPDKPSDDLLTVLSKHGDFNLLVKGTTQARLQGLLRNNKTPYTFFAPTDRAFEKLSKERVDVLMTNATEFKDFLQRHLVASRLTAADLGSGKIPALTSIAGSGLAVSGNPKRIVLDNASLIVNPDVLAANGILHGIDAPLPSSYGTIETMRPPEFTEKYKGRAARFDELVAQYRDPSGRVRPDLLESGIEAARRLPVASLRSASAALARSENEPSVKASHATQVEALWTPIGPQPLIERGSYRIDSGEATGIAIDPRGRRTQVIYLATHAGGVWKTTDGGLTWLPKTERMPSLSIGAVALDPANPDIVYAGTCSPFDGVGLYFGKCRGLYKSLDGGEVWSVMGGDIFGPRPAMPGVAASAGAAMYQIALPATNVLLLATNQGLYRSVDGGENFGANSPDFNDRQPLLNGTFVGVAVDTTNSNVVYASQRGMGVLKSSDGGATFTENLFLNPDGTQKPNTPVSGQYAHLAFTQSTQPNNQTLYVSVASGDRSYLNLFKSTDGGATWSTPSTNVVMFANCRDCFQGDYDNVVAVDPRDPNRVFVGFQNIHYSTNGGVTFNGAASWAEIHPDHRAIVFSPLSHSDNGQTNPPSTDVFVGNDGGIYSGSSRGLTYWRSLNSKIATTLVMQISMGNNREGKPVYAALWDHGASSSFISETALEARYPLAWMKYVFGDGGGVIVDPDDPTSSYQIGNFGFVWTTNSGVSRTPLPSGVADNSDHAGIAGARRYTGTERDSAAIGGHLYTSVGRTLKQDTTALVDFPITINHIQASRPPRLWVTLWQAGNPFAGSVWYRAEASTPPFTNYGVLGDSGLNTGKFARVAIDPVDPNIVCAVYSGFTMRGPPASSQHVFLTTDSGDNWIDISGDLPDLPVSDVVIDPFTSPRSIIISTDAGVLRTLNPGPTARWQMLGRGLPIVNVTSLAIYSDARQARLRAGTWGRSVWELVYAH